MSIIVEWHKQEQTIICITLDQGWTWQELYQIDEQVDAMLNQVVHKVSYIVDLRKGHKYAADYSLTRVRQTVHLRHPNSDRIILVGSNMFLRLLLTNVFKIVLAEPSTMQFADSIEEAEILLGTSAPHTGLTQQLSPS